MVCGRRVGSSSEANGVRNILVDCLTHFITSPGIARRDDRGSECVPKVFYLFL